MGETRFPNLFIIGAMKAGTSSLHEYLHQHPAIFMTRFKEPQYFAPHTTRWGQRWGQGQPFPEPGMDWYLRLFEGAGDAAYAGESSVSYTARPWVSECERRIHDFNPEARLIYLMRDPVERTISHYWHFVNDGREDLDMLSAVRRKDDYVARSAYAMQLGPYVERFGRDQVFVLTLEELNADPAATFRRLFSWLGVSPDVTVDTRTSYNVSPKELRQTRRHCVPLDTAWKHWRWKQVKRRLPAAIPAALERATYRPIDKARVDARPAVEYLRPILREHTRELAALTGRDFSEWTTLFPASGNGG
jgi:hypothetical protein